MSEPERRAALLYVWAQMGAWFGSGWQARYGGVNDQTIWSWQGALGEFTAAELEGGVAACERWEDPFPPTFPQFRALLLTVRNRLTPRREPEAGPAVPLADLSRPRRGDTPIALREKERIRRILAGEEVETRRESWNNLGLNRTHGPCPKEWP